MNKDDVRRILGAYRPENGDDALFAEALQAAVKDPELSRWWAEEQVFDQAIAAKVQSMPVSAELQARLLQIPLGRAPLYRGWGRNLTLLAAAIAICTVLFSSWRGPFQPAVSLGDYRDEMVSFIKLPLPLELGSHELPALLAEVEKSSDLSDISIPPRLRALATRGCRMLRFRGYDVGLICFTRPDGRPAHLFVLSNAALPPLPGGRDRTYAAQGEWMTAAWSENGQTYLLAVQGDRNALDEYFSSS